MYTSGNVASCYAMLGLSLVAWRLGRPAGFLPNHENDIFLLFLYLGILSAISFVTSRWSFDRRFWCRFTLLLYLALWCIWQHKAFPSLHPHPIVTNGQHSRNREHILDELIIECQGLDAIERSQD